MSAIEVQPVGGGREATTPPATSADDPELESTGGEPSSDTPPKPEYKWRDKGAANRRAYPIHAYIGPNGSGKSLAMVHDTVPSLKAGRTVLSTVGLLDPETGEPAASYERLTDWIQILDAEHCDLLFDEVLGIASSRQSAGMPSQVTVLLNQLRRRDIVLRWSAPAWSRADIVIRECTQAVTVCRGFFPGKPQNIGASEDVRQWRPNRLFRWSTFDASDFTTWTDSATDSKKSRLRPKGQAWMWGPSSEAFRSYNTLDAVERVGEVLDSGACAYCGGHRARPKCTCDADPRGGRVALLPSPVVR